MNTILGTQMHWLTAVFIVIESYLFVVQIFHFLNGPHDRQRLWYLILLGLLIKFNISNGLFPDTSLGVNIKLQYMIAYGFAYLMGAYIPYYFYKAYDLRTLRLHATWGVCLFLFIPYLIFDVLLYSLNGKLIPDRELGVIIPAIYGLVVLVAMLRAILRKYKDGGSRRLYRCALIVWGAILPWELMSAFAFFPAPQWLRIGLANLGWLAITLLQFDKAIRFSRKQNQRYRELTIKISREDFIANCKLNDLSARETEIAQLMWEGMERQAIADKLFISKHTVKTHISHIYEKTSTNSREELIGKLSRLPPYKYN